MLEAMQALSSGIHFQLKGRKRELVINLRGDLRAP